MRISDWSSDVCSSDLHRRVDVGHRHLSAAGGHAERDVARAARHVEDRFARARFHASDELILPQPVQSSRHQIVHQVIAGRNAAKDVAHPARLFLTAHLLVTDGYLKSEEHTSELQSLMRITSAV